MMNYENKKKKKKSIDITKQLRPIFKLQQHSTMPGLTPAQLTCGDRPDR